MPPTRTGKNDSKDKKSNGKHEESHTESIQKLKNSLRSAKRLIAKDDLDADVRLGTERRIEALEQRLEEASHKQQEREMAKKYHMVKFFDKKKTTRKIKQIKKRLGEDGVDDAERKELEVQLLEQRIDLNYILHYPKLEKYISLHASSKDDPSSTKQRGMAKATEPTVETESRKQRLRTTVRTAMEDGRISRDPELDSGERLHGLPSEKEAKRKAKGPIKTDQPKTTRIEDDEFFGDG